MATTTTRPGMTAGTTGMSTGATGGLTGAGTGMSRAGATDEAHKHAEGPVARGIEHYTAQMPSDWFLWAAGASILGSLTLQILGRKHDAQFVGQWAPTLLILGLYNKIVKIHGHD